MALCFLWAVFDTDTLDYLPAVDVDRIKTDFTRTFGAVEGNPVKKIKITVVKVNGSLDIVEVGGSNSQRAPDGTWNNAVNAGVVSPAGVGTSHETLGYLQRMERTLAAELQAIRNEQASCRQWIGQLIDKVIVNQRRFGGTIGQALKRQNQERQARNRAHAAATVAQRSIVTPE